MKKETSNPFHSADPIFSIQDQVVIVTGSGRGIGKAIARGFFKNGAKVVLVSRSGLVAHEAEKWGDQNRVLPVIADLACPQSAEAIVQQALQHFGRINTLVNNAAVSLSGTDPYSAEIFDQTLAVNLRAALLLSRSAADHMRAIGEGTIINIASINAHQGFPWNPSYQAAKAGLLQLTRAMALDWAPYGIRVNSISPGYVRTDMTSKSFNFPELRKEREQRMMIPRWGEPEDLVGPAIFLASKASCYMTGSDLRVDGGWTAKGL